MKNIKIRTVPLSAILGLTIIAVNLIAALFAPWLAPHSETAQVGDIWMLPSSSMPFGTDSLGRDMLSRILFGARTTIAIALAITAISFVVGIITGFTAAIYGRWVDVVLTRIVDTLMSIPVLILALIVLSVLGTSIPVLVGTIALLDATRVFRLARLVAQGIVCLEYVEAARLRGEGLWWIVRKEFLPNAMPPLLAEFGMRFCFTFLFIAGLSFLGLGIQPPWADWGSMVRDNAQAINFGQFAPLYPAAAIALLTIGVNLVVDWLLVRNNLSLGEEG
ncbi:ABC transporter permease [Enterobacter sp. Ap-916]|uniref:ABC transporter permease n=1 Tax=Enterobacteriaceae TaxID=543 RepID=UPI000272A9BA|nr:MULTISPECIES: ABC transporter permease [Enterobacteriaceae]AJZ88101.1 ABC transporter permease [Klebsiella michiganensis]EJF29908.1 binding-protein-dependent transporter inner membrane component [Enterobacter sp. Ag1]NIF33247.1 ABC transporter permease [Enterobacter sp. Cy-643]NIF48839.1 ABC transporter permease [Enterobacter sp. Ap-1006]NIF58584.1 ABC transporter permease [Enterobacter sp. Ap-867]